MRQTETAGPHRYESEPDARCHPRQHRLAHSATYSELLETLIARRHELGLTQEEVNWRAGVSMGLLAHWENGQRAPSLRSLIQWVEALGFSLSLNLGEMRTFDMTEI